MSLSSEIPSSSDALIASGLDRFRANNFDSAIADFDQAIRVGFGADSRVYRYRGAAYAHKGQLDKAIADFDRAIEIAPSDGTAYYFRGRAKHLSGNFQQAISDYDCAIKLDPTNSKAMSAREAAISKMTDDILHQIDPAALIRAAMHTSLSAPDNIGQPAAAERHGNLASDLKDRPPSTEAVSTSIMPIEVVSISLDASMWAVPDEVAITHKIRTNGPSYQVNLRDFSCSCQSWLSDRCRYNTSDIRRLCKHQVRILEKNNLFTADALMLCLADAVPLHSRPYCIARIKSSDIGCTIIRYQNEPWLDVLVSAERRPLRRYGLNIEEDRWAYGGNFGERPPESKRIKALVHAWLARPDSARFHEVPDLPEEAVIAKQKFAEEAVTRTATTQMTEDEAKGRCFICRLKIAPTSSPHERGTKITCPKCGNINYVANSGTLFNLEKIEIWAKYQGNYDDPHSVGLLRQARSHAETQLNDLKADLMSGAITKDDYRTKSADIRSELSTHESATAIIPQ
jgi:tetratricopeptide (TPR) repeat protein/Zn finger protein HypA/HybF involved in hydrogenase expression